MGNNQAYSFMEETVVGAYNLGKLDVKLLKVLMEPYRGTDIDSGGSCDLKSKDGLSVEDIVIKIMEPSLFLGLEGTRLMIAKHPKKKPSKKQREIEEKYYDARYEAFHKITDKTFGWR